MQELAGVGFEVLGPLRVRCAGSTAEIAAAKHRTVMAVLLIHANQVVSVDHLIVELWGERPPLTARKTVQGYVWRLRRSLGADGDRLVTDGAGYRMVVAPGGLDAVVFESLVAAGRQAIKDGRHAAAERYLREAGELWRGPAFANVVRSPSVAARAARLEETRLAAAELRMEVLLALGDHARSIPELTDLAMRHPARESAHRLLMVALLRAGRRADALRAFNRLREFLVDEYGLEPDAQTRRIQQQVLRADLAPV